MDPSNPEQKIIFGENKIEVPLTFNQSISVEIVQKVLASQKFNQWAQKFNTKDVNVHSIKIDYVFMFGSIVGFVNLIIDCHTKEGKCIKLPGFVFLRGAAVGILVVINNTQMILTKQFRVPIGKWIEEIPAGMIDEDGNFKGVAAKELEEETGIKIELKELVDLGSIFPSSGGCDEEIFLYAINKTLSQNELQEMSKKIYGEKSEQIHLVIKDFSDEVVTQNQDPKLTTAYYRYLLKTKRSNI